MNSPTTSRTSPLSHEALATTNGSGTRQDITPSETQLALVRAAEVQAIQERQMLLQANQYNLNSGLHDLQMGANTVKGLLPLLDQLFPHVQETTGRHMEGIVSGRADGFVTTTTLEFFVEDEG